MGSSALKGYLERFINSSLGGGVPFSIASCDNLIIILYSQGRLNELMSQLRMQTQVPGARADQQCVLDPMLMDEMRQV